MTQGCCIKTDRSGGGAYISLKTLKAYMRYQQGISNMILLHSDHPQTANEWSQLDLFELLKGFSNSCHFVSGQTIRAAIPREVLGDNHDPILAGFMYSTDIRASHLTNPEGISSKSPHPQIQAAFRPWVNQARPAKVQGGD